MAWATPKTWEERMVTAAMLDQDLRDNFSALDQHTHTGAAGDGSSTLDINQAWTNQANMQLQGGASPTLAGELKRAGTDLRYYNGTTLVVLTADAFALPSSRTLGTGSSQAASGTHTH